MHIYVCIYACIHIYIYIYIYSAYYRSSKHSIRYMHVFMCVCVYIYIYVCVYIYIHTYEPALSITWNEVFVDKVFEQKSVFPPTILPICIQVNEKDSFIYIISHTHHLIYILENRTFVCKIRCNHPANVHASMCKRLIQSVQKCAYGPHLRCTYACESDDDEIQTCVGIS
jgi:hypothetical protein